MLLLLWPLRYTLRRGLRLLERACRAWSARKLGQRLFSFWDNCCPPLLICVSVISLLNILFPRHDSPYLFFSWISCWAINTLAFHSKGPAHRRPISVNLTFLKYDFRTCYCRVLWSHIVWNVSIFEVHTLHILFELKIPLIGVEG